MIEVFKVMDTFVIEGKGIVLVGITKDESLKIPDRVGVVIQNVNGDKIFKQSLGFELLRNCFSPHKPRNMALLVKNEGEDPNNYLGSIVWSNV